MSGRQTHLRVAAGVALLCLTAACGLKQGATDALKQAQQNGGSNSALAGAGGIGGTGGTATGTGTSTVITGAGVLVYVSTNGNAITSPMTSWDLIGEVQLVGL